MTKSVVSIVCLAVFSYTNAQTDLTLQKSAINKTLNAYHQAAANSEFDHYFTFYTKDAIFIGTDPTENWNKQEFIKFSKPYFDRGRAWNFTALERNVYFSSDGKTVWFDELLNTQMKICRGSGVLVMDENGNWKIKYYVLSMTIPNDNTDEVVKIKSRIEDKEIEKLKKGE